MKIRKKFLWIRLFPLQCGCDLPYISLCHLCPVIFQFAMVECVVTGLSDEYPKFLRRYKPYFLIAVCVMMFLLAIPMCAQVGKKIYFYSSFIKSKPQIDRPCVKLDWHPHTSSLRCWRYYSRESKDLAAKPPKRAAETLLSSSPCGFAPRFHCSTTKRLPLRE